MVLQVPGTLAIDNGANGNGRVMASQDSGYLRRLARESFVRPERLVRPTRKSCIRRGKRWCASLGVELGPLAETHPPTRPIPP